jgi:hypothetical protein
MDYLAMNTQMNWRLLEHPKIMALYIKGGLSGGTPSGLRWRA